MTLNRIAIRAASPDRNERFSDAREMLAELDRARKTAPKRTPQPAVLGAALLAAVLATAAWVRQSVEPFAPAERVSVNFVTAPFEATVVLDGKLLIDPQDGKPYTTPCTISELAADDHEVVLRRADGQEIALGRIDFRRTREIEIVDREQGLIGITGR